MRVALSVVTIGVVIALGLWALRRRERLLATLVAVGLVAVAAATVSSARVIQPETRHQFNAENAAVYRLFWWPVGVVFTLALLWGAVRLLASSPALSRARTGLVRFRLPTAAAFTAAVIVLVVWGYEPPVTGLRWYYRQQEPNADAIAEFLGSADTVALRLQTDAAPASGATEDRGLDVWDLGPYQRYAYTANLVAQLRLRGISVRFADEPDDGITFMRAYRDDHPATGDEVEVLFRVGPDANTDPPRGYEQISSTGAGPGEEFSAFDTPTAVLVRRRPAAAPTGSDQPAPP